MDEVLVRRLVGLLTLVVVAFLLSWLLPRPGLQRLQAEGERVVTMDLTRPDSQPEEVLASDADAEAALEASAITESPASVSQPAATAAPEAEDAERAEADADADAAASLQAASPAAQSPETVVAARPGPKPAAPKPPEPKPVVAPAARQEPKPEARPPPRSEVASVSKAAPAPTPAAPATKSGRSVSVQAGAYSFLDKAEAVRSKAQAAGVACVISPADTAKGTLYRVRCGPYAGAAKATDAVHALKAQGIVAAVVPGG